MHDWFINPNFHVILIHYPLGVFVLGAIIEIFAFLWPKSPARAAARWMLLLGALLMLPTIMSGIYALHDVTSPDGGGEPLTAMQLHQMTWHIWLEGGAVALTVLSIVVGLGASDQWRRRLHWPMVLVLICVLGLMTAGAWYGGEAVYRTGLAVDTSQATAPVKHDFYYFVEDPLQIHMMLVGCVLALTAVALGLSIRRITLLSAMRDEAMLLPTHSEIAPTVEAGAGLLPDLESLPPEPRIASTRYWIFTFILAALTAGAGYWFWGHDNGDDYGFKGFWLDTMCGKNGRLTIDRTSVHVCIGVAIVVMTLVLAGVIHFARPSKLLLTIFAGFLVLLLAAQIWVGILLTFGHGGHSHSFFHLEPTGITAQPTGGG